MLTAEDQALIKRLKRSGHQWQIVRLATALKRTCSDIENNEYGEVLLAAYKEDEIVVKQELLMAIRKCKSFNDVGFLYETLRMLDDKTFKEQLTIRRRDAEMLANISAKMKSSIKTKNSAEKAIKVAQLALYVNANLDRLIPIARMGEDPALLRQVADYVNNIELAQAVKERDKKNFIAWAKTIIND